MVETLVPAYMQVVKKIRKDIVCGVLEPNEKLDSIKTLSKIHNVNPNTMQKALNSLEREGLLKTKRTAGKYITDNTLLIKSIRIREAKQITDDFVGKLDRLKIEPKELKMIFSDVEFEHIVNVEK